MLSLHSIIMLYVPKSQAHDFMISFSLTLFTLRNAICLMFTPLHRPFPESFSLFYLVILNSFAFNLFCDSVWVFVLQTERNLDFSLQPQNVPLLKDEFNPVCIVITINRGSFSPSSLCHILLAAY